jgi:AraC-like DNA-binding protein
MPGSVTWAFGEPKDFQTALREDGVLSLLVTAHGQFRARLTQVTLHSLRLSAGGEHLPRIAFVAAPADTLLISFPTGNRPAPIWGGLETKVGELITLGPGQRVHARTDGPCCWGAIRLPNEDFAQYGRALKGAEFVVSTATRWRPQRSALRQLRHFHQAAVRTVESRSTVLADNETAHGLEQQMIHALVECFDRGEAVEAAPAAREHQDLVSRLEALLHAQPNRHFRLAEICAALEVPTGVLRLACEEQLGMGPTEYVSRRRMQLVHRALLNGNLGPANISTIATHHGFRSLGRFAADYRAIYRELPSETLRRSSGHGMGRLRLRCRHRRA